MNFEEANTSFFELVKLSSLLELNSMFTKKFGFFDIVMFKSVFFFFFYKLVVPFDDACILKYVSTLIFYLSANDSKYSSVEKKRITNLDAFIKGSTLFRVCCFFLEHPKYMGKKLTFTQTIGIKLIYLDLLIDPNFTFSHMIDKDHSLSKKERPELGKQSLKTDEGLLKQIKYTKERCVVDISETKSKFFKRD
jgi:hypothetical protein